MSLIDPKEVNRVFESCMISDLAEYEDKNNILTVYSIGQKKS